MKIKGRNKEMWVENSSDSLISETFAGPEPAEWVVNYSYDLVGNRTQMVDNGQTINYTLSANRLTSWGTSGQQQFDSAGNVTNIQYDDGRQVSLTWSSQYQVTAAYTNGGLAETYGYDVLGRRISISDGATMNYLVYDGIHCVAEADSAGNLLKSYSYGPGIDNILSMTVYGGTTQTYYYVKDHLGSVQAIVDGSGSIVESYQYDAWGNTMVFDGSGNPLQQSQIGNRYLWQGREYSFKTKLYNFRARYYDSETGRWLSNDPIGVSGGLNQYVFCINNSVNFVDPLGLDEYEVYVWRAQGSSPGHIMITEGNNTAILSQFPHAPGKPRVLKGPNQMYSYEETLQEEELSPNEIYVIDVPNNEAFDSEVCKQRRKPTWFLYPIFSSQTHCTRAARDALNAGGITLPNTIGPYMPGTLGDILKKMTQDPIKSGVSIWQK